MPQHRSLDGTTYEFPDEATEEQITRYLARARNAKPPEQAAPKATPMAQGGGGLLGERAEPYTPEGGRAALMAAPGLALGMAPSALGIGAATAYGIGRAGAGMLGGEGPVSAIAHGAVEAMLPKGVSKAWNVAKALRGTPAGSAVIRALTPVAQEAAGATQAARTAAPMAAEAVAAPAVTQAVAAAPAAARAAPPAFQEGSATLAKLLGQQPGVAMTQAPSRVVTQPPPDLVKVGQGVESQIVELLTTNGLSKAQVAAALREMSAQPGSGFKPLRPSEARKMVEMVAERMAQ